MKKIRIIDCAAFTFVSAAHLAMAAWLWQPPMAPVIEPTRVFRRQFILSHATLADSSNWR